MKNDAPVIAGIILMFLFGFVIVLKVIPNCKREPSPQVPNQAMTQILGFGVQVMQVEREILGMLFCILALI